MGFVNIAVSEDVGDATEQRVVLRRGLDDPLGRLMLVVAPVIDPLLAEDALAEGVEVGVGALTVELEGMGAGAQRHDRHPAAVGVDEVLHLRVRPGAIAQEHDDPVGRVERLGAGQRLAVFRVDRPVGIDGEEHRTFEPVPLAKNFCQHRQPLFAAVFLVSGEEDDVLALARAVFPVVIDEQLTLLGAGNARCQQEAASQKRGDEGPAGMHG